MACFLVPAGEAIVTTIINKNKKNDLKKHSDDYSQEVVFEKKGKIERLSMLNQMLRGGVVLLMFEHVWHGEVVPFFPFLTAASDPADRAAMFHEMGTVGVTMAICVTLTWRIIVKVTDSMRKRAENPAFVK